MIKFYKPKMDGLTITVIVESANRVDLLQDSILLEALRMVTNSGYYNYVVINSPLFTKHKDGSMSDFVAVDEEVVHQRHICFAPVEYIHGVKHSYLYGSQYVKGDCYA